MKCLWYAALALVMVTSMTTSATAQDFGSPSQIGSYQSILSSYAQQGSQTRVALPVQGSQTRGALPIQGSQTRGFQGVQSAPIQGAPIQGMPIQGAPIQGGIQTAPIQGGYQAPAYVAPTYTTPAFQQPIQQTIQAAPIQAAPIQGAPIQGAPIQGGSAPTIGAYQPAVAYDTGIPCGDGSCGGGAIYSAPSYGAQSYGAPAFVAPAVAAGPRRNRVIGARGLIFNRNYENNRQFSYNGAGGSLYSNDANHNSFGGFEGFIASRGQKGGGWEARYLGLFPGEATAELVGSPIYATTALRGLQDVFHANAPAGIGANVFDVYNLGVRHTITRRTDIDSVEFNFLRNGGCYRNRHGRPTNFEVLAGFRWFQFNENLRYDSFFDLPDYPQQLTYDLDTQNTLLGVQLGSRAETCVSKRLRFTAGTRVGLFNNRSRVRQSIFDNTGYFPVLANGADAGRDFNFSDQDNGFAVLGELDLGVIYQLSCRTRLTVGYRAIGVSGVALAGDQVPNNFASTREIREVDNSGSLILYGGYAGLEMCF